MSAATQDHASMISSNSPRFWHLEAYTHSVFFLSYLLSRINSSSFLSVSKYVQNLRDAFSLLSMAIIAGKTSMVLSCTGYIQKEPKDVKFFADYTTFEFEFVNNPPFLGNNAL